MVRGVWRHVSGKYMQHTSNTTDSRSTGNLERKEKKKAGGRNANVRYYIYMYMYIRRKKRGESVVNVAKSSLTVFIVPNK